MLQVAVIGSGPAGVYAAAALTKGDARVDVLDRLPCPFGLVRYGVAPDHPKIKSISSTLKQMLEHPAVRFLGNVEVGTQITVEQLHRYYDAIIVTSGAAIDRHLGIPGEELPGVASASDFVAWYCGHPDTAIDRFTLDARSVAVVGAGNVAIDVTRILARSADDLRQTDVPARVLRVLDSSLVEDIYLLARRGPVQAKFTPKELRELGDLTNADVVVDPRELELDDAGQRRLATEPAMRRNLEVLRSWAERPLAGHPRRIHLRFRLRPVAVLGDGVTAGLRLERTKIDENGSVTGTGSTYDLPVQLVLRSVGYRGLAVPGLPFDQDAGVIPNAAGRVLRAGKPVVGEYVAGWIKRGPTGVIGTNKHDANETVAALFADAPLLQAAPVRAPDGILDFLAEQGIEVVNWQGWCAIERAEAELGRVQGRSQVKITEWAALLRAAADGVPTGSGM
ncbi:MAG TPA: FAD-dependent oxidoreductase [Mycobacteriales bacterium]|jgi:ferredoxin--NADP+ reductase|nr:FAD-dependent oxidoreductase [Mycobacteriales bacterium]